jgi:ketosteroid isomerase-like protein
MAPYIFYRVEDEDSRARYLDGKGLFAEDANTWVNLESWSWKLFGKVEDHLDWGSRTPSIFISAYCNEKVALREADRRVREGKEEVVIYEIDTRKRDKSVEYRNMRLLAKRLGVRIPECAWNNSVYEYIFLHHVPESAIVGCTEFE